MDANGLPDFTIRREPIAFRVDDDVFRAPPIIGGFQLRRLGQLQGEFQSVSDFAADADRLIVVVAKMFETLMPGSDGKRFAARLMSDGNPGDSETPPAPAPIDLMRQALPVLYFLLERYGLRPTVSSSISAPGSMDGQTDGQSDGISSMAGASAGDSATT